MISTLSTRAFNFLHKISKKAGLQGADHEIHDMGTRLLSLWNIAAGVKDQEVDALKHLLTEPERQAFQIIREKFTATGRMLSVRELSRELGYQSSRSGHQLVQRLLLKGFLLKRGGKLTLPRE